MAFVALYARHLGFGNAGLYFFLQSVGAVVARLSSGKIADRYGPLYTVIPGALLGMAGFACLLLTGLGYPFFFYMAGPLCGSVMGLLGPAMSASGIRGVSSHRRGAALATIHMPVEIAIALGSLLWGFLIDNVGFHAIYIGAICSLCVSAAMACYFFNEKAMALRNAS